MTINIFSYCIFSLPCVFGFGNFALGVCVCVAVFGVVTAREERKNHERQK